MQNCSKDEETLNNIIKKIIVIEKLMKLTDGRCFLSLEEEKKSDKMQYHHLEKDKDGGETTYYNGVLLLTSNHQMMHVLERKDKGLFIKLNTAMDMFKEALELEFVLSNCYSGIEVCEKFNSSNIGDTECICENLDDSVEIPDIPEVEELSLDQLIEVRKAIRIYTDEVIPAFLEVKKKYNNGELGDYYKEYVDYEKIKEERIKRKEIRNAKRDKEKRAKRKK